MDASWRWCFVHLFITNCTPVLVFIIEQQFGFNAMLSEDFPVSQFNLLGMVISARLPTHTYSKAPQWHRQQTYKYDIC